MRANPGPNPIPGPGPDPNTNTNANPYPNPNPNTNTNTNTNSTPNANLLEAGADPNLSRAADPVTPLHYAAYGGFDEAVVLLLEVRSLFIPPRSRP